MLSLDFKKAFFNGLIRREVCIDLPKEDPMHGDYVGLLHKSMYGLREAPAIWAAVVDEMMANLGFDPCPTVPCVFVHRRSGAVAIAHVDDFLISADKEVLQELKAALQAQYECEGEVLGPDAGEVREISFLGRRIQWSDCGVHWLGDTKQTQTLLEKVGLAHDSGRRVESPGVKREDVDETAPLMGPAAATEYRSLAALVNYISADRVDIGYSAKELCQKMARPQEGDDINIKRVARYLRQYPQCSYDYKWQAPPRKVAVFTDSDWGGCTRTRRSTSGGAALWGGHLLAHWSRTQQSVSLSSCEAEINALVKGGTEGRGIAGMLDHCGETFTLELRTDASAAIGVCQRSGAGRVKHLAIKQLWLQGQVAQGALQIQKVPRAANVSDLLTHHCTGPDIVTHLSGVGAQRHGPHG